MKPPPKKFWRSLIAAAVSLPMVLGVTACKTGNAAQKLAESTAPTLDGSTGKCEPGNEAAKSLVVEWSMGDRAALEGRVQDRLVAVRYRDCEMELITTCSVAGSYHYVGVTPKSENIKITNADELYASIPIGAVRLEGQLERAGELNVDMVLVGRHEADRVRFQASDLDGRCDGATHVVTGLTVGAFTFYSGAAANIGLAGGVKGTGAEAGVGSTATNELLSHDGDPDACVQVEDPTGPPMGCGALMQVEVVPIDRPAVTASHSSTTMGQLTDTNGVTGVDLTTAKLDKQIKAMTVTALSSYLVGIAGVALILVGYRINQRYSEDSSATDIGPPGSDARSKYISQYNASLGMLYGGIGGAALGLGLGLWSTTRRKKLRNERSTRLAGVDASPLPGGGVFLGSTWRF